MIFHSHFADAISRLKSPTSASVACRIVFQFGELTKKKFSPTPMEPRRSGLS